MVSFPAFLSQTCPFFSSLSVLKVLGLSDEKVLDVVRFILAEYGFVALQADQFMYLLWACGFLETSSSI